MKKLIYLIISLYLLVSSCDKKIPKEDELMQYPWIEIFTHGSMDFKGIEHNIDNGTYSFSFKTSYSSIDAFLLMTDSGAVKDKWEIIQKSAISRKYKKKSTIYLAADGFDFVTLSFNPEDRRIIFTATLNK